MLRKMMIHGNRSCGRVRLDKTIIFGWVVFLLCSTITASIRLLKYT
jgi:hypothetical protein